MRRLIVLLLLLGCCGASAHDARPVTVTITETLPGVFAATLRVPPTVAADNIPTLVWPETCEAAGADTNLVRCTAALTGASFTLAYPQFNPSLATFYRLQNLDGGTSSTMLAPNEEQWIVPDATTRARIARDYLLLGVEHIIGGLDHLLFVLGLLVIAHGTTHPACGNRLYARAFDHAVAGFARYRPHSGAAGRSRDRAIDPVTRA